MLTVVIPAYNESAVVANVIADLRHAGYEHIVVVDDGSKDETVTVARAAGATVLRHIINLGQGAALQTGIEYALANGADFICTFDADGQHTVESIRALQDALVSAKVDVALGSRFVGATSNMPTAKRLLLRAAILFTRLHSGLTLTDTHNGLRVLSRSAASRIRLVQPGMAHASELLRQIKVQKMTFVEVPVTIRYTDYSMHKGQSLMNSVKILLDLFYMSLTKGR